jgi:predicted DNA-binding protein with PD1-like motif
VSPPSDASAATRAYAIRLRPNQDFTGALEAFCATKGIRRARFRGGVGSTIGARLENGKVVENFATEVYVRGGEIVANTHGNLHASVDVGLIDYTGAIAEGRYVRGDNPVLMTFELVLEVL